MDTIDYDKLNPGIREVVRRLREAGFETADSGDGSTHDHACDLEEPYVHIMVRPPYLILETDKLREVVESWGIELTEPNEDGTAKTIEASYSPLHSFGVISLFNVADTDLPDKT